MDHIKKQQSYKVTYTMIPSLFSIIVLTNIFLGFLGRRADTNLNYDISKQRLC